MTVADLAERVARVVPADVVARVTADPRGALRDDFGLTVRDVPELADRRGAGGWCDGMSFLDHDVVLIAATGNRRDNFTAVHELAHLLVLRDDEAMNWLADHPDPGTAEELLCDRVAARLLVPPTVVTRLLDGNPPRARHIAGLHAATSASEPSARSRSASTCLARGPSSSPASGPPRSPTRASTRRAMGGPSRTPGPAGTSLRPTSCAASAPTSPAPNAPGGQRPGALGRTTTSTS